MSQEFDRADICRWRPVTGFEVAGQPVHVVGSNYVARHVCSNFWADWRPDDIAADLDRIAAAGLNAVRIPVHWGYAEPEQGVFRPEMIERMGAFLGLAAERGLLVMPWFLVGVATGLHEVPWRRGESFFSERMTGAAANHLRHMVGVFRDRPNVLCWDICDEPEWYSKFPDGEPLPYDPDRFQVWLDRLIRAIREVDDQRAVTLGFGHIASGAYGLDIRGAARSLDVMAVTAYAPHMTEDLVHGFRSTWFLSWSARFNDCASRGVFTCEAPGWSDIEASPEAIGHYYRASLFSDLAAGSRGALAWVWNDFDDAIQALPPLDDHTTEKRFGICRPDGTLKPAGAELQRFARFVRDYPPTQWPQIQPEVGVIVPGLDPTRVQADFKLLLHHFVLLRQAGLRVRYVWPADLEAFDGRVLFLPHSTQLPLETGHWLGLRDWVSAGGTLLSSSGHVSAPFNELFGVTVEGRVTRRREVVLPDWDDLSFPGGHGARVVTARGASVAARDSEEYAVLTEHEYGQGRAFYLAYPPEVALGDLAPEDLAVHGAHRIVRRVAERAGLTCPVTCDDPRVELDVRQRGDGSVLTIAINHSRFPATVDIRDERTGQTRVVELPTCGATWFVARGESVRPDGAAQILKMALPTLPVK